VIQALASALGAAAGPLQEAADLERAPPRLRRRLRQMDQERGSVSRTRDRLLSTTLFHLSRSPRAIDPIGAFLGLPPDQRLLLGRLVGRARHVANIEDAARAPEFVLEEAGPEERDALAQVLPAALDAAATPGPDAPLPVRFVPVRASLAEGEPGSAADGLWLDAGLAPAPTFLWTAPDEEAHPRVEAGDLLLLDPTAPPRPGDLIVGEHEGRARVRVWHPQGPWVRLDAVRPDLPPLRVDAERFRAHLVRLVLRGRIP